ncbi:hypothetical protein CDAR_180241 [Caerostris darwini]|uniref:Uncharacterized protein n=1 Tax=Caerostris darwini TaxID=1538125 RepID=A0AAV4PET4_9ARAC|nr:hypothetical protein CDAR_180241 [Caerostris darwini]
MDVHIFVPRRSEEFPKCGCPETPFHQIQNPIGVRRVFTCSPSATAIWLTFASILATLRHRIPPFQPSLPLVIGSAAHYSSSLFCISLTDVLPSGLRPFGRTAYVRPRLSDFFPKN